MRSPGPLPPPGGLLLALLLAGCGSTEAHLENQDDAFHREMSDGRLLDALNRANELAREYPDHPDGPLLAAEVHEAILRPELALQDLQEAYTRAPKGFADLSWLVRLQVDAGVSLDEVQGLVDRHAAAWGQDPCLWLARVVLLTARLADPDGGRVDPAPSRAALQALLASPAPGPPTDTVTWARVAEARLALDQPAEALDAMRAGADADPLFAGGIPTRPTLVSWDGLTLRLGVAIQQLQAGQDAEARENLELCLVTLQRWPGAHYGMLTPMADIIYLTLAVHYGEIRLLHPAIHQKQEDARSQGVGAAPDAEAIRNSIQAILSSMRVGRTDETVARARDLERLAPRLAGGLVTTRVVRPHLLALATAVQGPLPEAPPVP